MARIMQSTTSIGSANFRTVTRTLSGNKQSATMKFTIAILLLGALLESVAACSIASCTLTGTLTGTAGCTNYQNYINCLTAQKNSCTTSVAHTASKGILSTAITTNTGLRAALGCSGAGLASISSMALVLSVVVSLLKTHF